jgi:predicted amidohydrolase YtcJ
MNRVCAAATIFGFMICLAVTTGCRYEPEPGADLVLVNGRAYTLAWGEPSPDGVIAADAPHDSDGWHPDSEAVAVTDGRIVFVGSLLDAEKHIGSTTRVVDVNGAVIVPGKRARHRFA